jgi:hypothetical protein
VPATLSPLPLRAGIMHNVTETYIKKAKSGVADTDRAERRVNKFNKF